MKLGLNSAWAVFTSMGITPAARDGASIAAGGSITLSGRIYPALADGASVTLHYYYDGRWRSRGVTTTRKSESLPGGYTARYSLYSETVSPVADDQVLLLQRQGQVAGHDRQGRTSDGAVRAAARTW